MKEKMALLKEPHVKEIIILNLLTVSLLLSGCGTNSLPRYETESLKLSRETISQNEAKSKEKTQPKVEWPKQNSLPSLCKEFEVPLYERPIRMEPKALELTSTSSLTLESPQLTTEASIEERCQEIERNFSGARSMYNGGMIRRMTLFAFRFEPTYEQENQVNKGESIHVNPNKVEIEFTDGEHYSRNYTIALGCPSSFELKCENRQTVGEKKCATYAIRYPDQVCTVQAKSMSYMFSDQQNQAIDLEGEIKLSAKLGNQFVVKRISW